MTGRSLIATAALSDAATLTTAGTVAPTLPLANLQDKQPSRVCRWTSLSDISVICDLGASYAIGLVALLFVNATTAATLRIRIADSEANLTGGPAYDSGADPMATPGGNASALAAVTGRWVRLDISDPTNPEGFFEAGRLIVAAADAGTLWRPDLDHAEGWELGLEDDSQVAVNLAGGLLPSRRGQRRVLRLLYQCQPGDKIYGGLWPVLRARGLHSDLLVVRDVDATDYLADWTVYGLLAELNPIQHQSQDLYAIALTVREMI